MNEREYCLRVEELRPRLYRTALLYLGGESAAVDAVDEAVYKGLLAHRRLRDEGAFGSWMGKILMNVCNDELRRQRREITGLDLPEEGREDLDTLPLRQAVAGLPPELRQVVVLRYFTGLTVKETGQTLGIPQGQRPAGSGGPWSCYGSN